MPPGKTMNKILIVDDDPLNCAMFSDILEDEYIIKTAQSGESGLQLLPAFEPDLILLDIMLPGMNGYEICRTVRKDICHQYIKILLVSAMKTDTIDRLEGYEAGADDFIVKPFDNDELKHKIRIFLHLKRVEEVDQITGYLLQRFSIEARTPLNGLINPAQSIIRDDLPPDEMKLLAKIMLESANHLHAFVQKVTLFCELKKGLQPVKRMESLTHHLHDIVQAHDSMALDRSVKVDINVLDEIPIVADWEMIDKAIGFLVENALEHSPPGATVDIKTRLKDGFVQVAVSDRGEGVKPELVDKIFDGCRCMQNLARMDDCKGFSLALAKRIVDLHGGSISAFNNPGKGATFYVTLPQTTDP